MRRRSNYIDTEGPDPEALARGVRWLTDEVAASPATHAVLAVPTKNHLQGLVSAALGPSVCSQLRQTDTAMLPPEISLRLLTEDSEVVVFGVPPPSGAYPGPTLALYGGKGLLDQVDSLAETDGAVLVVPWRRMDVEYWVETWSAAPLDTESPPNKPGRLVSRVVEAALHNYWFGEMINAADPLNSDKNFYPTARLFKSLVEANEPYDPPKVRAWLVSHVGCLPHYADSIASVATHMLQRKNMDESQITSIPPKYGIDRWREEAGENDD